MDKSIYLIDGHAQIYRAYFAPFGSLTAPSGEPTRATHVFCQMVLNLLRDKKPDYLAVVMDVSDETVFRKDIYPDYKSHREPPPEDLPVQADRIVSILEAARIPILRKERFEADDILATLAKRFAAQGHHVYLVSKDKDLEQLLSERISLYDPGKDEVITPERLVQIKGWTPELAIEAQTLIGDTVDNVPGVTGVGAKTAAKLLAKYGSAQGVIDHADELTPKQRENVLAFAPQIELTRKLVTLLDDVPIDFDLESAAIGAFHWDAVRPIFDLLGIKRLADQLPKSQEQGETTKGRKPERGNAAEPPNRTAEARENVAADAPVGRRSRGEALADHSALAAPLRAAEQNVYMAGRRSTPAAMLAEAGRRLAKPQGGDYRLVNTAADFEKLVAELSQLGEFSFDTETTGLMPIDADLIGLSFAWEVGRGYYVPTQSVYGDVVPLERVREKLGPILADPARRKIGHHIKYDLIVLAQAGMPVAGPLFDTMIAAFVLDPMQSSFKMDSIVRRLLGHEMIPITDLIGKRTSKADQLRMDQIPLAHIAEYAAEDADYTWRLKELFEPLLKQSDMAGLFYETEMPLVSVLTEMEFNGIRIDAEYLAGMSKQMAARLDELAEQIYALAKMRFNLDSPKQLGDVLFEKLGMRVVKRTATARSTDAETLEVLAKETGHAIFPLLLEHREIQKLRGTYVDALPACRSRRTGRVHTSYHQSGAVTGRLSSSEPNLQNIPVRTELGREIRRAFVPRTSDELLIVADYSQIELRILAHFCEDEELIRAFTEDRDIHVFVAAQINGVPLEAVTKEMRGRAKAVNFGLIYGQTAFGLAQATGMGRNEAQVFIDQYFKRYPRIRDLIQKCIADARRDGFVRTILGRQRPIPDIDSRNSSVRAQAERLAVNTVMQGSAADLIKTAMNRLHRRIREQRLPLRMLLQVHDELVCEAPRAEAPRMAEIVRETMSGAMKLRVPLKVDVECAENWLDAK
jgi:DNA polymerase-1